MKLVTPTLLVLLSMILTAGYSQDKKSVENKKKYDKLQSLRSELQPTGDPPVTLSSGSLEVDWGYADYSSGGQPYWKDSQPNGQGAPSVISPYPFDKGSLKPSGCQGEADSDMMGDGHPTSANFWADSNSNNHTEASWDIAPAYGKTTTITITYGTPSVKGQDTTVVITVPASGEIKMQTDNESWGGKPTDAHRSHQRQGHVKKIVIQGSAHHDGQWVPINPNHPNFMLGFCFK